MSPVISMKQKVANIREKLDEFLVSTFSEVRKKLIVEFVSGNLHKDLDLVDTETCLAFFDSLLDGSFKSCDASSDEISGCFPDLNKLLEILSARSPDLESVKIRSHLGVMTRQLGGNCVQLLKNFGNLTSLSMEWTTPYNCLNFFSQLGESCPKLNQLHLDKFYFDIPQLFALMFGPKHSLIPQLFTHPNLGPENTMHKLEFEQEHLSPICSSLQDLRCKNFCDVVEHVFGFWTDPSTLAFILRHFRNLQKLSHLCAIYAHCAGSGVKICFNVVELLHETIKPGREVTNMTFTSESLGVMKLTVNAPFKGSIHKLEIHFHVPLTNDV